MKAYICDGCKKKSFNEEDIPEYRMFVCESFDGIDCMLCIDCENKIKKIIEGDN
jgi:hypothetical protein